MNVKKSLEKRIKGWFPSTPKLPCQQDRTPILKNTKALTTQLPPMLENKFQRNGGILIGIGIGVLLIGTLGALVSLQTYSEVRTFLNYGVAETNNYVLNDLISSISIYLTIIVAGAAAIFWGGLLLRSNVAREITLNKRPHGSLGNGLLSAGGGLAIYSTHSLFAYILTSDQIQLELFIPLFAIGTFLVACGILAYWRK
jgi:hypothetical protein